MNEEKIDIQDIRVKHLDKKVEVVGEIDSLGDVVMKLKSSKLECPSCVTII